MSSNQTRPSTSWATPVLGALGLLTASACSVSAAEIFSLGALSGSGVSRGVAVSGDGSAVLGVSILRAGSIPRAFRWTPATGPVDISPYNNSLGSFPGGISADGTVISGNAHTPSGYIGFRWTASNGMQSMGVFPDAPERSSVNGVSGDGLTIVGGTNSRGYRWTQADGFQSLGTVPNGSYSTVVAVNGDGSAAAGQARLGSVEVAVRWTSAGGMEDLGHVGPGGSWSSAVAISADGEAVAGTSAGRAFRWTPGAGMMDLGLIPGATGMEGMAISGNGLIVGGQATYPTGIGAFLWTPSTGAIAISDYFASLNINTSGWVFQQTTGMSHDGSVITGTGRHFGQELGWVAMGVPAPGVTGFLLALALPFARRRRTAARDASNL